MDSPLVSIVIPCHNAGQWVADAIESALAQTYSPTEVLVVDDGSTDGSINIIRSFGTRVNLILQSHRGAPKARNRGLREALGEFIHFLDADDILFPHCVTRKMDVALNESADVVYSGGFFFDLKANAGTYESHAPSSNDLPDLVAHIIRNSLVTTVLLCRRDRLVKLGGFNEDLTNGQEHDLLLRLALTGAKFAYVPKALSCNRTNHNVDSITSVTQRHPKRLEELFSRFETMLKKTELWLPPVRAALGWRFHKVGVEFMAMRNREQSIAMFEKARAIEPNYIAELPLSRRLLVPICGGYTAERLLTRLRRTAVLFKNHPPVTEFMGQANQRVRRKLSSMHQRLLVKRKSFINIFSPTVECNLCHWRGRGFVSNGWHGFAICPSCGSHVRHRLLVETLTKIPHLSWDALVRNKRVLHFAPEPILKERISHDARYYLTADLSCNHADIQLDISNMKAVADESFDLVIACDVLEHVPDDSAALQEIHRVLTPNAWAILTVPQKDGLEKTYEDPDIVTTTARKEAFGQEDHLRIYGEDFSDRIRSHGFWVTGIDERDFDAELARKHVLFPPVLSKHPLATNYRKVFFARKKDGGKSSYFIGRESASTPNPLPVDPGVIR